MEAELWIEPIDDNSPYLEMVITLGRKNAGTLGHMPRGAFLDHAAKRQILVALSKDQCVGYLMYRTSECIASIAHLCVDPDWRSKHIAKQLVSRVIQDTKELYGIKLSCRRDYNLDTMWSSFGFTPRHDKPGKSKDGKLLTVWVLDHKRPYLLEMMTQQAIGSKLCAVLDSNVFYDLDEGNINRQVEDSKSLLADWLQSEVKFCITDEIDIEINRYEDEARRKELRAFASTFTHIPCTPKDFQEICQSLRKYFPEKMTENDGSDLRHLARAIGAKAQFFITRDGEVLEKEDSIYLEFNVSILRPSDLIVRLDELRREADYQPIRVGGTSVERRLVQAGQQRLLTKAFLSHSQRETRVEFQHCLRRAMAEPDRFECCVVWDEQKDPLALVVYDRQETHELKIPLLRVRRNYAFSLTVLRHLVLLSIRIAAQENRQFTRITDVHLDLSTTKALVQDDFVQVQEDWLRANLQTVQTAFTLSTYLRGLVRDFGDSYSFCLEFATALDKENATQDIRLMSEVERSLYPAKIIDADIPSFIISIQPQWAENLFDEGLADQDLFGASKELALRREVVYYRAARNAGGLKAPGRILWYVSQGKKLGHYHGVKAIRACSRLDEIIIDKPKNLFRQFRRLGVYKFSNVLECADNDLNNQLMAVRFSDTELFTRPIPFVEVQKILEKNDPLLSPRRISVEAFNKLYNNGI